GSPGTQLYPPYNWRSDRAPESADDGGRPNGHLQELRPIPVPKRILPVAGGPPPDAMPAGPGGHDSRTYVSVTPSPAIRWGRRRLSSAIRWDRRRLSSAIRWDRRRLSSAIRWGRRRPLPAIRRVSLTLSS